MFRTYWRSSLAIVVAGLMTAAPAAMLQQPAVAQTTSAVQTIANRTDAQPKLPRQFIDSRPILAYFEDKQMPTTVRGLLETLRRPDVCGKRARTRPDEACALVFYKLDESFTPDRLRPPLIIKAVFRVTQPENLAKTVMIIPDANGAMKPFVGEDLYEPLRTIRANVCLFDKRFPERCSSTGSTGVRYRPLGILGNKENDQLHVLPERAAARFFGIYAKQECEYWMLPSPNYAVQAPCPALTTCSY